MTDHDDVRDLLAAWAFGALEPVEEHTVRPHLATCESCAAEAERLRTTARLLDGPPAESAGAAGAGGATSPLDALLARARRTRSAPAPVARHAAPYAAAVAALGALLPELAGRWSTPVVHDWDVHATLAHLLAADEHLALRLGVGARVPGARIDEDAEWGAAWERRTAEVIAHEYGRTPEETVAAWSAQAADLLATPYARDSELAAGTTLLLGIRLPVTEHFLVRGFEAWIHTDDIGRALGIAVPPPPEEHLGQLVRLAVRILGGALGAGAPPVLLAVRGGEEWVLGSQSDPVAAELTLDPVDFCLLVGGRYAPDTVPRNTTGDAAAVRNVLEAAASLSWL
ncbi:maleylpyruvate isomerase family mycothiol-dependent enzyme [Streptomyces griseorubiginosus]|uniref:maleylpyruvate isomerase family mycothiol-dependent enzyme n=1 Tax=Streptomyces griseorubiginosus TaxID=67304 RepID=UPI002E814404|nr:maleylpyruvate isomerase family mycothiol-dependent enzyme [Streptomyces griseorubiginosus]WUB47994.1 maleylpyruvate isomerase family mycothiol-dependent enzyme [Streptomyces griseorubiginosus]WUB56519.1 maleylpyruvate isomerase family mycothiol-dependent enzyme [Streptomyces griseorubiginosus]